MTWLSSLGTGLLAAILAGALMGYLADRWTVWFRMSSFEGASGYFVLFQILFAAVLGFILGILCSRTVVVGDAANFWRGMGLSAAWIVGIVGTLGVLSYLIADHPPTLQGRRLTLEMEFRTPPDSPLLQASGLRPMVYLSNAAGKTTSYGVVPENAARREGDRWVVPFAFALSSSSPQRTITAQWTNDLSLVFPLPLRAKPTEADFSWTDWLKPGDLKRANAWADASVNVAFEFRYRVAFPVPPPPPPSDAERAAEKEKTEAAQMAALPADAPIQAWFPFTQQHLSQATQDKAFAALRARADFTVRLIETFLHADPETAGAALRLVTRLPGLEKEFIAPLERVGQDLAQRLEKTVLITPEEDPSYRTAADDSIRFSGWFSAIHHLRKAGLGNFTPELRAVLVLARKRPDSIVLRDITRVASFYMKEWAGEEPLPTDPPPR